MSDIPNVKAFMQGKLKKRQHVKEKTFTVVFFKFL